jgi:hypothetical protein
MGQRLKTHTKPSPKARRRRPARSVLSSEDVRRGRVFTLADAPLVEAQGFDTKVTPGDAIKILNNAIADCMLDSFQERSLPPQHLRRKMIKNARASAAALQRAEGGAVPCDRIQSRITGQMRKCIQILDAEMQRASARDNHKRCLSGSIAKWLPLYLCDAFRRIYGDDAIGGITGKQQSVVAEWMWNILIRASENCTANPTGCLTCPQGSEQTALDALSGAVDVNLDTVIIWVRRAIKSLMEWSLTEGVLADPREIQFDWAGNRNPVPRGEATRIFSRCLTEILARTDTGALSEARYYSATWHVTI